MISLPVQPDSIITTTTTPDSSIIYKLKWNGRLEVSYKHDPYFKAGLARKVFVIGGRRVGVVAYIDLLEPEAILDREGNINTPLAMQYRGYWIYEKMGTMLPVNYKP